MTGQSSHSRMVIFSHPHQRQADPNMRSSEKCLRADFLLQAGHWRDSALLSIAFTVLVVALLVVEFFCVAMPGRVIPVARRNSRTGNFRRGRGDGEDGAHG